ncbi:hypothetical protein ACFL27_20415, partial [candidate division CSSED10-310 bacterium]
FSKMFVTTAACPGGTVTDSQQNITGSPTPANLGFAIAKPRLAGVGSFCYYFLSSVMIPPGQAAVVIK